MCPVSFEAKQLCPVGRDKFRSYYLVTLSVIDKGKPMENEFVAGFIRLHILYHAHEEPVFGLKILRELRRHGYELSPGTLYPLLHRMETRGLLESEKQLVTGKIRRVYRITDLGRQALLEARQKVRELFGDFLSQESPFSPDRHVGKDIEEP